jgi:Uma2 family endonuclease
MTMIQLLEKKSDQRIIHQGTWAQFKLIQQGFNGSAGIHLSYYNETIEIFMPGQDHEMFARMIGYLLMTFFSEKGIFFKPTGAMTQEKPGIVSVQADESYFLGKVKSIPDLSIEVIFTSDSISKLERYRALGVREVWFWEDGLLSIYALEKEGYCCHDRSQLPELESLNIDVLKRCILLSETDPGAAIQLFRQSL